MRRALIAAAPLAVAVGLAAGGFYAGRHSGSSAQPVMAARAASSPAAGERRALYWHDPMVPGQRFDKPGKSPFMDMQLVPVYADEAGSAGVRIDPTVQQNLGIRTTRVRRTEAASTFDAVGTVQFDERLTVAVQTRVGGYVERLAVRAPMERVRKGQTLATIFAPDWLGPQNEWLALMRAGVSEDLVAAARDRLRAMSVPDALVRQSEAAGSAQARFALVAPVSGVVAELGVREGVAISPGTTLFRLAGLEKVWAVAEVPEAQALRLVRGQKVKAELQVDASQAFVGELAEIVPQVSAASRTLQARFEVDNRGGRLTPGTLLRLRVAGPSTSRLVVASEAVIRTGTRVVAIVRQAGGGLEPRDIEIGADLGDQVEVTRGLAEGDEVVASGQFLIDSEAHLRSALGSMAAPAPAVAAASSGSTAAAIHVGTGRVESVRPDAITISHGPIASLKWPPMTMGFGKSASGAFADIKPGDTVRFEFKAGGASGYELMSVQRIAEAAK